MIINTGQRTDIPAYYSEWFYNRIKENYVHVRNPYYPEQILEYQLNPQVVDCLCFCTKNPQPMLKRLDEIKAFRQFWFVTITPYGKEIEPHVPHYQQVIKSFQQLSLKVGKKAIGWRYDPIFIDEHYTIEKHLHVFLEIAKELSGYTDRCVISFIDLYEKTKRNFPHIKEVTLEQQHILTRELVKIAQQYHIKVQACLEDSSLAQYGIDTQGCMTQEVIEESIGERFVSLKKKNIRAGCSCLLGSDIGAYNTCLHGCLYCYANVDKQEVIKQYRMHDPYSSILIGHVQENETIKKVKQISNIDYQLSFDL